MKNTFLLYGAYGYTGQIIVRLAKQYGLNLVLAGVNEKKLKELSDMSGFDFKVFSLKDQLELQSILKDFPLLLNCAGPFIHTFKPLVLACMHTGTHYLDITGEIEVFEFLAKQNDNAIKANIMMLPGIGFDVVPSDCMAAFLKSKMPDARELKLAILSGGGISRGTLNTAVESIGKGGMIRESGKLKAVPNAYKEKMIDFGNGPLRSVSIPWGDVSTAYYSTGIPNIVVYLSNPPFSSTMMKLTSYFNWILNSALIQRFLKYRIKKGPPGPSDEARQNSNSMVWGEVIDKNGNRHSALFKGPEAYTLTAHCSLMAVDKILNGLIRTGFQTPSLAFGHDFILELEGTKRWEV